MDCGLALPGRQACRIDPVLDSGSAAGRPLHPAAQWHRVDDAHRHSGLARRTDAADQRHARCLAPVAFPRRGADFNSPSAYFLPADLAMEATSCAASESPMERTVNPSVSNDKATPALGN